MNVIDAISRNHFLKELFPDGLTEDVLLGHLGFNLGDSFSLNLHTKQRPAKEISKWGEMGERVRRSCNLPSWQARNKYKYRELGAGKFR